MTGIQWTNETWNPTTGCDRVSPGCDNCYALTMAKRLKGMGQAKYQQDGDPRTSGPGFGATTHHGELEAPLRWRKPRRVFVDSMGDLFHDSVPSAFIASVFDVMRQTPQHTYQILTKRHGRMRSLMRSAVPGEGWPLPNVHLGVSVEDQTRADLRIPALLETTAAVRFLSCEPLLSPVDLRVHLAGHCPEHDFPGGFCVQRDHPGVQHLNWTIIGGESGPGARPCDPRWISDIVEQCRDANVPMFVKQFGSVWARENGADGKGGNPEFWPEDLRIRQFPATEGVPS